MPTTINVKPLPLQDGAGADLGDIAADLGGTQTTGPMEPPAKSPGPRRRKRQAGPQQPTPAPDPSGPTAPTETTTTLGEVWRRTSIQRAATTLASTWASDPPVPYLPPPVKFSLNPEDFFRYWHATDTQFPHRLLCYLYRVWPKIDRTKEGLVADASKYIDKIDGALPPEIGDWRQEIFHRYGSGAYKFVLTDGLKSKAVCQTVVPSKELDDLEEYPPHLNYDELIMDHPDNQSYVRWLNVKGLLQQESDMQQGEAMKEMTGLVRDMVLDKAKQQPQQPVPESPNATATAEAIKATAKAVAEAATMGNEIMKNAFNQVAQATAEQSNPKTMLEIITAVSGLVNRPQADGEGGMLVKLLLEREATTREEMVKLNSNLFLVQTDQIRKLQEDLQAIRANPQGLTVAAGAGTATPNGNPLLDAIRAYKELKAEIAEEVGDEGDSVRSPKVPVWLGLAETTMKNLPVVAAYIVQAIIAAKAQPGQMQAAQMPVAAALPAGAGAGEATMAGGEDVRQQAETKNWMAFLKDIEGPIIRYMSEGRSGDEFASAIVEYRGLLDYRAVKSCGADTIKTVLNAYPPIAQVVQRVPQQFDQFLDEFMRAEEIWAAQEAEDRGEGEAPTGRPVA